MASCEGQLTGFIIREASGCRVPNKHILNNTSQILMGREASVLGINMTNSFNKGKI